MMELKRVLKKAYCMQKFILELHDKKSTINSSRSLNVTVTIKVRD